MNSLDPLSCFPFYDGGPLSDPGARLGARRHLILPPGGGNSVFMNDFLRARLPAGYG
ncbi:hypothetical protein IUJ34_00270 [Klebsiella pneumoniae subsp. pneumoniae]|uniref:Uncharacterized protein n=1 Tax=Klebsiella pneumoniae subsp. pneumoniae TaxID=72407 RepID=A0A7S9E1N1_KLEPN|nr:hypothetical protein IUJ34_00270 [Klebsiella pneumoniae subsp. pneumoniae]